MPSFDLFFLHRHQLPTYPLARTKDKVINQHSGYPFQNISNAYDLLLKKIIIVRKTSILVFLKTKRYKELPTMTPEIISVIAVFACAFNRPTWK